MKNTIAPKSDNRVVSADIRRSDTDATPASITSVTASLLLESDDSVIIVAKAASAVSGEVGTYAATFTAAECASLVVGTKYEVEWVITADSLVRYQRQTVTGSYE